ncbi:MAG: hypothetical protein V3T70_02420 [Phycisphaerae bacterium]
MNNERYNLVLAHAVSGLLANGRYIKEDGRVDAEAVATAAFEVAATVESVGKQRDGARRPPAESPPGGWFENQKKAR